MNISHLVFLLLFLPNSTFSLCSTGCLSCNQNKECILCDFLNSYRIKNNSCVKATVSNCTQFDLNGQCLTCLFPNDLDPQLNQCIQAPTPSVPLKNCKKYDYSGLCVACENSVPLSGECVDFLTDQGKVYQISNCLIQSRSHCFQCSKEYVLNETSTQCIKIPSNSSDSCHAYSQVQCLECEAGYQITENYVNSSLQNQIRELHDARDKVQQSQVLISLFKNLNIFNRRAMEIQTPCIQQILSNCEVFSQFNVCEKCEKNFYLKENQCHPYPKEKILNCLYYLHSDICEECSQGFFLENAQQCSPVIQIDNCDLYDGRADETKCTHCERRYFLNSQMQICTRRTHLVDLCQEYENEQDSCKSCIQSEASLVLTTDKLHCLEKVPFCATYATSSIQSTHLICEQCVDLYYLDNTINECQYGSVKYCKVYEKTADVCIHCKNKYFLKVKASGEQECSPSTIVDGCVTYNNQTEDKCLECKAGSIMLTKNTQCEQIQIENCLSYSAQNVCSLCQNEFDLVGGTSCQALPKTSFCLVSKEGVCEQCLETHVLKDGKCKSPLEYEKNSCQEEKISGSHVLYDSGKCVVCNNKSVPYDTAGQYLCVSQLEVNSIYNKSFQLSNCFAYTQNETELKCKECKSGFFLTEENGEQICSNTCQPTETSVDGYFENSAASSSFKKEKYCFAKTNASFDSATSFGQKLSETIQFAPVSYQSQHFTKQNHEQTQDILLQTPSRVNQGKPVSTFIYTLPEMKETLQTADLVSVVENCDFYYYQFGQSGQSACNKCRFGYFGVIKNYAIKNCLEFGPTDCIRCIRGFYLNPTPSSGEICLAQNIPNCELYSENENKCRQCHNKYFINATLDVCTGVTEVDNCQHYSKIEDKCYSCKKGFILNSDESKCLSPPTNCLKHVQNGNDLVCQLCKSNYYINDQGLCEINHKPYCWFTPKGAISDDCLLYNNAISIKHLDYCEVPEKIKMCTKYSSLTECEKCDMNSYLIENKCCLLGTLPANDTDKDCTGTVISDCLIYQKEGDVYSCATCKRGFHLTSEKCCPNGSFWNILASEPSCTKVLQYSDVEISNAIKCALYDVTTKKCIWCVDDHYLTHGKCCPESQFWNTVIPSPSCSSISEIKEIQECLQWSDIESEKCKKCNENFHGPQCCSSETHYADDQGVCQLFNADNFCEQTNSDGTCKTCQSTYYSIQQNQPKCCAQETHYWDSNSLDCLPVGENSINGCANYESIGKCSECQAGFYLANPAVCCAITQYFNGKACITGLDVIKKCIKINKNLFMEFLPLEKHYLHTCEKCAEGYTYNSLTNVCDEIQGGDEGVSIDNCLQQDGNVCIQCYEYFALNIAGTCCEEQQFFSFEQGCYGDKYQIRNSFFYNKTTLKSVDFSTEDFSSEPLLQFTQMLNEDKGTCSSNSQGVFLRNDFQKCCDKTLESGCYDTVEIPNCMISYGYDCKLCHTGFSISQDQKSCINHQNAIFDIDGCQPCKENFIHDVENGVSSCCNTEIKSLPDAKRIYNCSHYTDIGADFLQCQKCRHGYYLTIQETCCKLGQRWDTNMELCVPLQQFCSQTVSNVVSELTGLIDCSSCFLDNERDLSMYKIDLDTQNKQYSWGFNRANMNNEIYFKTKFLFHLSFQSKIWMDTDSNQCCPLGQFFDLSEKQCAPIPIKHCLQSQLKENKLICIRCEDSYLWHNHECQTLPLGLCNSFKSLDVFQVSAPFNLSNDHCCQNGTYWEKSLQKCTPIQDPFCKIQHEYGKCSTCFENFVVNEEASSIAQIKVFSPATNDLPEDSHFFSYKQCIPSIYVNEQYTPITEIKTVVDNCGDLDHTNMECKTCNKDSYKILNKYCCKKGTSFYRKKCYNIEKIPLKNCLVHNLPLQGCLKCAETYTEQMGMCCPEGSFLDTTTLECSIKEPSCAIFDIYSKRCVTCKNGHYQSDNHCCQNGHYWEPTTMSCQSLNSLKGFELCLKLPNLKSQLCRECVEVSFVSQGGEENSIILLKGKCINSESLTKSPITESKLQAFPYLENCLDENQNKCVQCMKGFQLFQLPQLGDLKKDPICCPFYTIPVQDSYQQQCVENVKAQNCINFDLVSGKCIKCNSYSYLSNDHCCLDGYFFDIEVETCSKIFIPELYQCDQKSHLSNQCMRCTEGHYLSYSLEFGKSFCVKTEYYYNYQENIQNKIPTAFENCIQMFHNGNTDYQCMKCNQENQMILQIEIDGTRNCISQTLLFLNCQEYDLSTKNCKTCKALHYKSYTDQEHCCPFLKIWNGIDCIEITMSDVSQIYYDAAGQIANIECVQNYYKSGMNCLRLVESIEGLANCNASSDLSSCQLCSPGHFLNDEGICTAAEFNTTNCSQAKNPITGDLECIFCSNQTSDYLSEGQCCPLSKYFDQVTQKCLSMSPASSTHCVKFSEGVCLECDIKQGYYLNNDFCVLHGYHYFESNIVNIMDSEPNLAVERNCNYHNNEFKCIEITETYPQYKKWSLSVPPACKENYVFRDGYCCKTNQKKIENDCEEIILKENCAEMSHDGSACQKCSDENTHYLSNGNCCAFGTYWPATNGTECVSYDSIDPDCTEVATVLDSFNVCKKCGKLASVNDQFPECCPGKYQISSGQLCTANLTNCIVAINDSLCDVCEENYYKSNNKCCKVGYYNKEETCVKIKAVEKCLEKENGSECSKCAYQNSLVSATKGVCCDEGFYFVSSLEACVENSTVSDICHYNGDSCSSCKKGFNLTYNVCCPVGLFLEKVGGVYKCVQNTIDNCREQLSSFKCAVCEEYGVFEGQKNTLLWLSDDNFTAICCPKYTPLLFGWCQTEKAVEKCASFIDGKCTQCESNLTLNTDEKGNQHCCAQDEIFIEQAGKKVCIPFTQTITDCEVFDHSKFLCNKCGGQNVLSQGQCCPQGKFFSTQKRECLPNYFRECQVQNDWECEKCNTQGAFNQTDLYLTNGQCCPVNHYFDPQSAQCIAAPYNCKEFDSKKQVCTKCNEDDFYLIQNHCCPYFTYWNQINFQCESLIKNCQVYEDHFTAAGELQNDTVFCKNCGLDYILTPNKKGCCQKFGFYDGKNSKCIQNQLMQNVFDQCIDWSTLTLQCTKCIEGLYLSSTFNNSHCCSDGNHFNEVLNECVPIDDSAFPNCSQISYLAEVAQTNICVHCKSGYYLDAAKICQKNIENCLDFNIADQTCSKCVPGFYLSYQNCCPLAFYRDVDNSTCVQTAQIAHCIEYAQSDFTKCSLCEHGFYAITDKTRCVTLGKFWNGTEEEAGQVNHCEAYGASITDCVKCQHLFAIQQIHTPLKDLVWDELLDSAILTEKFVGKTLVSFCFPIKKENCKEVVFNSTDVLNQLNCQVCEENTFIQNFEAGNEIVEWLHVPLIKDCKHTLTQQVLSNSTYECLECEDGFFFNKASNSCDLRDPAYIVGCERHDFYSNDCQVCKYNYFLESNKTCKLDSTPDCLLLDSQNPTTCLVCNPLNSFTYITQPVPPETNPLTFTCRLKSEFSDDQGAPAEPSFTTGYINDCHNHHQCKEDFLGNLDVDLQKYLSCHVCQDPKRIPFISLIVSSTGSVSGIKRYSMWAEKGVKMSFFSEGRESKQSECFLTDFSEFDLMDNQTATLFPENCAIGVFNPDHPLDMTHSKHEILSSLDYTKANPFCGECKPGFKPTRNGFHKMVIGCVAIANCGKFGQQFSACDECSQGFYFAYDASNQNNGGIDRTQCIKAATNHDENCFVFDEANSKCHTCKEGFSKNHDEVCEKLIQSNCTGKGNFQGDYKFSEFQLTFYRKEKGCSECAPGYSRVFQDAPNDVCLNSEFSSTKTLSKYSSGCDHYKNTTSAAQLPCVKCKKGFIITEDFSCVPQVQQLNDCQVAINTTLCGQCQTGFALISQLCQLVNIEGCTTIVDSEGQQKCNACGDGYFLNSISTCTKGKIPHCKTYQNQDLCNECMKDSVLVVLKNNQNYCMPLNGYDDNCHLDQDSEFFNEFRKNSIKCAKCKPMYFLKTIEPTQLCSMFNQVDFCTKYHKESLFVESTLKCLECRADRFLGEDQVCHGRTIIDPNCITFELSKDLCAQCHPDFLLSEGGTSCAKQPQGIQSCRIYSDENNCILCNSVSYLLDMQCFPVDEQFLQENCLSYNQDQKCTQCRENYSLEDGACLANEVENCKEHASSKSCKVCNSGFGLFSQLNVNTCVAIIPISNCVNQSQVDPYFCLDCANGYFVSEDKCQQIPSISLVKNCIQYESETQCKLCEKNHILSVDKKSCTLTNVQNKCANLQQKAQPFCVLCSQGKQVTNSLTCEDSPAIAINGCFLMDLQDKTRCSICQFGFSMNQNFTCIPNLTDNKVLKKNPITKDGTSQGSLYLWVLERVAIMITLLLTF